MPMIYTEETYKQMHEQRGQGFGKKDQGYIMYLNFIRPDGSLYIDAVPVIASSKEIFKTLAQLAPDLLVASFEATNPEADSNYITEIKLSYRQ